VFAGRRDGTRLFRLRGEFDLSNAWKVEDVLLDAIEFHGEDVLVDLADVTFMDAQLVRTLLRARLVAEEAEVGFVVVPPSNHAVWRVARIAALPLAA
jgi:anti-anti-sigma factor